MIEAVDLLYRAIGLACSFWMLGLGNFGCEDLPSFPCFPQHAGRIIFPYVEFSGTKNVSHTFEQRIAKVRGIQIFYRAASENRKLAK
jgi:hypothetical protein